MGYSGPIEKDVPISCSLMQAVILTELAGLLKYVTTSYSSSLSKISILMATSSGVSPGMIIELALAD